VAQFDGHADVLARDLAKAASPADGAVGADLSFLAVEEDLLDGYVPRDRPDVFMAGEEVLERPLPRRVVDPAVVLAPDPRDVTLVELAEGQRLAGPSSWR
jgi:hypothetical protein